MCTLSKARRAGSLHRYDEQLAQTGWQHKTHAFEGFTDHYNATRLVYWESFDDVRTAIDREKKLKSWRREKKLWLIAKFNPGWKDLAAEWYKTA